MPRRPRLFVRNVMVQAAELWDAEPRFRELCGKYSMREALHKFREERSVRARSAAESQLELEVVRQDMERRRKEAIETIKQSVGVD